jgi:hypothetical protein
MSHLEDSTCIMSRKCSLPSHSLPVQNQVNGHSQSQRMESNSDAYQSSTYFYDLKLAEFIRHNQYPPCVHLNSQPCQSLSTDYGFGSSEPFSSSSSSSSSSYTSTSTLPIQEPQCDVSTVCQMKFNQPMKKLMEKNIFISSHESVV